MPIEITIPKKKRVIAFIDGQNLYHACKQAFEYDFPNYDVKALSESICNGINTWRLKQVRFYTGVHAKEFNDYWHSFWALKLLTLKRQNVHITKRTLRYHKKTYYKDGIETTKQISVEKGIDVRIALDVVRLAHLREYDIALIFSQDQDLAEVVDEVELVSNQQRRWIKVACAFPESESYKNLRGLKDTKWVRFSKEDYDECIDPRDYHAMIRNAQQLSLELREEKG